VFKFSIIQGKNQTTRVFQTMARARVKMTKKADNQVTAKINKMKMRKTKKAKKWFVDFSILMSL